MELHRLGRAIVRGTAAAVLWGLVAAALSRLLMRAVPLVTGGQPGFSVIGTLGIGIAFVVALLPGAIALAYSARRWAWVVLGAGVALLVTQTVNIGIQDVGGTQPLSTGRWILLIVILVAMAAVVAAQAMLVSRTVRPRSGRPEPVRASAGAGDRSR